MTKRFAQRLAGRVVPGLVALLFCVDAGAYITSNVLQNGGFEDGAGSTPDLWRPSGDAVRAQAHCRSGSWAAALNGNDTGTTNYTLFVQPIPTEPGVVWRGEGWAAHFSDDPLTPENRAVLQISFLDEDSNYVFGTVSPIQLHNGMATEEWIHLFVSAKAPPRAAYACLNPLLRQCNDGSGTAWFDDCSFGVASTSMLNFAGQTWRVADHSFDYHNFENVIVLSTNCVWVDSNDWLHLTIQQFDDKWWCSQIESTNWYGYGEYCWYTKGRVDRFDTNANLGLFTYAPPDDTYFQEIDIELTYAIGNGTNGNLHYTVQPWQIASNGVGFQIDLTNELTTHKMTWYPGHVDYISYYGHHPEPVSDDDVLAEYSFISSGVPAPWEEVMMNLWLVNGKVPRDTQHLEAVICDFTYTPFSGWVLYDDFAGTGTNVWNVAGPVGSQVVQTKGTVAVSPNGQWQTAGLITSNVLYWSDRGPAYTFWGLLSTVEVTQANSANDLQGILSLCSEPNNAWMATNAVTLYAAYDRDADALDFLFYTKTNWPNHEGLLRSRSLLTNASARFSEGGVRVGFSLEGDTYRCLLLDADGEPLAVEATSGSITGLHRLGFGFSYGYCLLGGQNVDTGQGWVVWSDVAVGVDASNRLAELQIQSESSSVVLDWQSTFDKESRVTTTTNLNDAFLPFTTNHASQPNMSVTLPISGDVGFYRLESVE